DAPLSGGTGRGPASYRLANSVPAPKAGPFWATCRGAGIAPRSAYRTWLDCNFNPSATQAPGPSFFIPYRSRREPIRDPSTTASDIKALQGHLVRRQADRGVCRHLAVWNGLAENFPDAAPAAGGAHPGYRVNLRARPYCCPIIPDGVPLAPMLSA